MSAQPHDGFATTDIAADTLGVAQQALRREVNEQISLLNHDFGVPEPEKSEVLCECIRPHCTARILMTVAEYELVRRFPTRFFIKEGHEVAADERVVTESDDYLVIEAAGLSSVYAAAADLRRRTPSSGEVGT
jgi:hypothetical protein